MILSIESSAKSAGAALMHEGRLLAESFINVGLTHSQTLMKMVEDMLCTAGIEKSEIDRFAVSAGPGSFTGIRIGVAAVKGMALAAEKPCVAVPTLLALAHMASGMENAIVVPAMDARREQVYAALFTAENAEISRICPDMAVPVTELLELCRNELEAQPNKNPQKSFIYFVGDGAELCYNICKMNFPDMICRIAPPMMRYQRAAAVAAAAETLPDITAETLIPVYLRESSAKPRDN